MFRKAVFATLQNFSLRTVLFNITVSQALMTIPSTELKFLEHNRAAVTKPTAVHCNEVALKADRL